MTNSVVSGDGKYVNIVTVASVGDSHLCMICSSQTYDLANAAYTSLSPSRTYSYRDSIMVKVTDVEDSITYFSTKLGSQ